MVILLVGGSICAVDYVRSRTILEANSVNLAHEMSFETTTAIQKMLTPAEIAVKTVAYGQIVSARTFADRMPHLDVLQQILEAAPGMESIYIGYASGDFFMFRAIRNKAQRAALNAPANARFVLQTIDRSVSPAEGRFLYFSGDMRIVEDVAHPEYPRSFDPRTRPWYQQANSEKRLIRTPPYVFASVHEVGTTLAIQAKGGDAVVGCDVDLATIRQTLLQHNASPGLVLALFSADGRLVESNQPLGPTPEGAAIEPNRLTNGSDTWRVPILERMASGVRSAGGQAWSYGVVELDGDTPWFLTISRLTVDDAEPLYLASTIRRDDLMHLAAHGGVIGAVITFAILALSIPIVWILAGLIARPLKELAMQADTVRRFELSPTPHVVRSRISEIDRLATRMEEMKRTIRRFLDTIRAVAEEQEFDRLIPLLLAEMLAEARADVGVLYLVDEASQRLQPAGAFDTRSDVAIDALPPIAMSDAPDLVHAALEALATRAGTLSNLEIVQSGFAQFRLARGHAAAVPLVNRQGALAGVFVLLHSEPIEQTQLSFISELTRLFVSAIETRELIKAQRELLDSFVKLIAKAIDAKSPHTGDHCNRVPELAKMLAQAACAAREAPWKDFHLDAQQWETLHLAAWLHDCGKITTPEYVIDKATKLETLYDRIHEVRMRFEVLKCHAEIDCLKAIESGVDRVEAEATRDVLLETLDVEFAFVAACNEGGEFMDAGNVDRLREIGGRTWLRTLDDRLGISREESHRKAREPAASLPVREPLLADKAEHLIERGQDSALDCLPGNPWGFRMKIPHLLFNRGEIYNLSVARGTLSDEERFKINEHILQTIMMLSALPFPRHMRDVPEIAGGHHEKMDGTGYPKGLRREEMSPLSRMMAIVDIFEALTAGDRPYKKGKTLSESIRIMADMKEKQHIDAEWFDLFLRSGVYLDYALRFMPAERIDDVDIESFLSPTSMEPAPDFT